MVAMLALVCGVFAFTGCADYESDINSLNERLDGLETGQIASMEDQIASMTNAIDEANGLIATLQGDVNGLEEARDLMNQQIEALNGSIEEIMGDIEEINGSIAGLESDVAANASEIKSLKEELAEKTQELADLTSRVAELEGAVENLEQLTKNLPELEETVAAIEENYLSKAEAADIYATIESVFSLEEELGKVSGRLESLENLNIGERLTALENNYKDLSEIVVPGLEEAIAKAQTTADNAQKAADAAQEFAEGVLGELEALKEALGVYSEAGKLEAKINELEAMDSTLNAKDEQFAELIEQLDEDLRAAVEELEGNISSLHKEIADTKEEILSLVVSKEEFPAMVEEQIRKSIEEEGGRINQAISDAIKEVTNNLMSQIEDLSDRLEDVEVAVEDLTKRIEAAEGEIDDLANRIQSLVYVPEYNDGRATVLSYTLNNVSVSDSMVVTATFQVTPAALAENVVNQYENVFVNVLPVLTRSSDGIAFVASEKNSTLVLKDGKSEGYIDVEVTVPVKTEDDVILAPGGFAISLYVASKEEVEAVVNGEETVVDMDAGTYIASDYIQTAAGKATVLDNAYVLYNEKAGLEYPTITDDPVNEVNYYERAWSVLDRAVSLYGDNNYDAEDDGTYTLHIKLGDEYYTLDEAAKMMRADVNDITPGFDYIAQYYDRYDSPADIAEYFNVAEEEPYGLNIDMAKSSAMTDVIGSYVFAMNTFAFGEDSRFGSKTVLENVGRYKVINLPINIDITADRVDWTYDFALAHANNSDNPSVPNFKPITNNLQYSAENLGAIKLADILALAPVKSEVRLGDSQEPMSSEAPVITFSNAVGETDSTGSIGIPVIKYDFSSETENVYHFTNTYYLEDYQVNCTVNFTLTLGMMPGDQFVNYQQLPRDIEFILTGADIIGIDNGYSKAFKQLSQLNPGWFASEDQLTGSMQVNDLTKYSSYRDGQPLYENMEHNETSSVYTRLSVEPTAEYPDGSYVRVSSSNVTAVGNVFDFVTTINTWYGVTYTFTNSGKVAAPEFELSYIPTHIYGYDGEDPYVQLDYHLNASGNAYVIDEANLRNYFEVTDIPDGFNGELTVKFEVLTQANPAEGYLNVPTIPVLNVNNQNGQLGEYTIDWSRYTARDLQIRATLFASADAVTTKEIELNSLDLTIKVYPLVEGAEMKSAADLDYFGNNYVMDGEYIVVSREDNETINLNLWEYVNAYARFSNGENFIPYENAQGVRYNSLVYVNQNAAMKLYGAELVFDADCDAVTGNQRREMEYSETTGVITYRAEDGEIANPIYITVEGQLNYYLDYNHVESYPVTVKIKLQDAE